MLVLSRKKQQSVVVECFERLLKVTVLEIRRGKVKLGFEVEDDVPVPRLNPREQSHAGNQLNRSKGRRAMTKGEMDRWEDDGGGADRPANAAQRLRLRYALQMNIDDHSSRGVRHAGPAALKHLGRWT